MASSYFPIWLSKLEVHSKTINTHTYNMDPSSSRAQTLGLPSNCPSIPVSPVAAKWTYKPRGHSLTPVAGTDLSLTVTFTLTHHSPPPKLSRTPLVPSSQFPHSLTLREHTLPPSLAPQPCHPLPSESSLTFTSTHMLTCTPT